MCYVRARMDILFVATEISPMVRATSLGDVVASLSKALRLLGHKVTVAVPRFPAIEAGGILVARRLTPLVLREPDGSKVEVTVFDGRLSSGVELLLLDLPAPSVPELRPNMRYSEDAPWHSAKKQIAEALEDLEAALREVLTFGAEAVRTAGGEA